MCQIFLDAKILHEKRHLTIITQVQFFVLLHWEEPEVSPQIEWMPLHFCSSVKMKMIMALCPQILLLFDLIKKVHFSTKIKNFLGNKYQGGYMRLIHKKTIE